MRLAPGNPMTRALALTLCCEAVGFVLAIPGMRLVSGVETSTAVGVGGLAVVLAVMAGASLRRPWGWPLAWLTQVAALALGLLTPWMFGVGGVFVLLFVISFVLGRRLEAGGTG